MAKALLGVFYSAFKLGTKISQCVINVGKLHLHNIAV